MEIYYYMPDSDNFQYAMLDDENDWNIITYGFNGHSLKESWRPIRMYLEKIGQRTSFPGLSMRVPAVTLHAWEIVKPFVSAEVEALPLDCREEPLIALNVTNVVDCLDLAHSKVKRFGDGSIMEIEEYAFKDNCINNFYMFVLRELPLSGLLITERFREIIERNQLQGLKFVTLPQKKSFSANG